MAPTLICVRHAQGYHNLGPEFHGLPDPKLTELGEGQCVTLRDSGLVDQKKISLVTASPLTRTIHTAFVSFQPALEGGRCAPKIIALPDTQETSDFPCDTGSNIDVLERICKENDWPVDISRLDAHWNDKSSGGRYSADEEAIKARARAARLQIRQLTKELVDAGDVNAQVILVTHGGYLHYFTEDWEDFDKYMGTGWLNTETRSYTFTAGVDSTDDEAALIETSQSRIRRGKQEPVIADEKQFLQEQGLENVVKA